MNILSGPVTTAIRKKANEIVIYLNAYLPSGVLTIDTISEKTSSAGVTIDGVLIKDGAISAGTTKIVTKTVEVAVSAAELIAMYTTPKELIAAPGAGYALSLIRAVVIYDSTATAFTSGGVITVNYGSGGAAQSSNLAATFLTNAGDKVFNLEKLNAAGGLTMPVNTSLTLTNATGVFATGTGVVRIQIVYAIHETSL